MSRVAVTVPPSRRLPHASLRREALLSPMYIRQREGRRNTMPVKSHKRRSNNPLTKERVFRAAVSLADDGGVASLTMRKLAEVLGVEAMSLYHHVANKDAILDGIVDAVFSEIAVPTGKWKSAMRRRALSAREALTRHPWAVGLMDSRRNPGPATLALPVQGQHALDPTVQIGLPLGHAQRLGGAHAGRGHRCRGRPGRARCAAPGSAVPAPRG